MPDSQKDFYKKLLGLNGEIRARKYLKKAGYKILCNNYRTRHGEIDVIALDGETVVFVEVKTRSGDDYGRPCEAVDARKRKKYEAVATEFLLSRKITDAQCRFDVIEVEKGEINHIKDAFWL